MTTGATSNFVLPIAQMLFSTAQVNIHTEMITIETFLKRAVVDLKIT